MATNLPPARDRIHAAADASGWTLWEVREDGRVVHYTRGPEQVCVTFSEQSPTRPLAQRITGAWSTTPPDHAFTLSITGPDKTGQVIARLTGKDS